MKPKISVTSGMSGYFAVMWDNDGAIQTGIGRYATAEEAAVEAREWAEAEELEYAS
jgi:hypothetical protein